MDILKAHLKSSNIHLGNLPAQLIGMSGADIAAVACDVKGHARHSKPILNFDHVR